MAVKDDADFVRAEKTERKVKSPRTPNEEDDDDADGAWYLNYDDRSGFDEKILKNRLERMKIARMKDKWITAAERAQ